MQILNFAVTKKDEILQVLISKVNLTFAKSKKLSTPKNLYVVSNINVIIKYIPRYLGSRLISGYRPAGKTMR